MTSDRTVLPIVDVGAYLAQLSPRPFWYVPNPGNAGDAMIAAATFQLFRRHGLAWRTMPSPDLDVRNSVIVYGGGGNLVPAYAQAREFIARHHARARRLVVLPHTVAGHDDLLAALGPNVTIVCREPTSFAHVRQHARRAEVLLAHDLALSLDASALFRQAPRWPAQIRAKLLRRLRGRPADDLVSPAYYLADARVHRRLRHRRAASARLHAFRTDLERTAAPPDDNEDLSVLFEHGCGSEALATYGAWQLLRAVGTFDDIHTNRLHVAIAGALLGKRVEFFENSYYKCRAIFEFSIAPRFPTVRWADHHSPPV